MFYHISSTKGLTELEPRVSTHGKSWVYALTDFSIGLVFAGRDYLGNKADDKFTKFGVTQDDIPEIFEYYSGCLDEILKNKDAYIYELEDSGFLANQTSWRVEWVSPNKTKVIGEKYVPDILAEIKKLEKEGKFIIHYYENTPSYNEFVRERIENLLDTYYTHCSLNVALIKHYEGIVKDWVAKNIDENYQKNYKNLNSEQIQKVFNDLDNGEHHGKLVPTEMFYNYPQETVDWINKKYEAVLTQNTTKENLSNDRTK